MASATATLQALFVRFGQRQLAGPLLILLILAMMVLPLPAFVLDLFFTFNIAISVIVMLVAMSVMKPLDFSVFPDRPAGDDAAAAVAQCRVDARRPARRTYRSRRRRTGHRSLRTFPGRRQLCVGLVVFTILVIINFVVITKGAGRVAEVAARFTLDAMPGKQMAIDADLNAGLIGEEDARQRRATIAQEADFFGSMDGASKFVRGDAVAGILIMLINVVGGLFIGVLQHNLDIGTAARTYTLLTIGDGLVAQIPALIISIAAGMVVTRVGDDEDVSQQFTSQLFNNPKLLYLTAAIIGLLGLIPGMPNFRLPAPRRRLAALAWKIDQRRQPTAAPIAVAAAPTVAPEAQEASWADVTPLDVLGLEVGYRLIPLVDKSQDGELLRRIRGIRKKFAQEVGFLVSPVHIRDNLELKPNAYKILLKGSRSARERLFRAICWRSIRAASPDRSPARRPGIRLSGCRRCGSTRPCASRRRPTATRWSMRAR
jgi:flagellar biosynthesis protein FlhA